jgi:hypothetical protein
MLRRAVSMVDERAVDDQPFPLKFASADTKLFERGPADAAPTCVVTAVAPSPKQQLEAISEIAQALRSPNARLPKPRKNPTAVVLWVQVGDVVALLGADLEREDDVHRGWKAVAQCTKGRGQAEVVKVPHHGAASAYDRDAWAKLVSPSAILVLAPWRGGGRALPTHADVIRMREASEVVLQAAPAVPATARRLSNGFWSMRNVGEIGRVTVRRDVTSSSNQGGTVHAQPWSATVVPPGLRHP